MTGAVPDHCRSSAEVQRVASLERTGGAENESCQCRGDSGVTGEFGCAMR